MHAVSTALSLLLSALWPQPRQVAPRPNALIQLPIQIDAPQELARPAALLRRELARRFGPDAVAARGKTVVRLELAPRFIARPEEYALEVTGQTLRLAARDEQGAFWAVHSLAQILGSSALRRTAVGYALPGVHLRDWPESGFRAFMIQGAWTPDAEAFRRNLEVMARLKTRYFALEFGPQVVLDFDPAIAKGGKFTKAQARDLVNYGRSLGMEPIGYLNLLGHLDRAYQKPPYTDHGGIMIQNDETYERFVYPILSEMLEVYGPIEYFHGGMDEAWDLFEWFSGQGMNSVELVARHVEKVNTFLKARGVKLVIWHDMFFHPDLSKELGAPVGPANGGPPQNTAAAFAKIPKDVILDYWYYDPLAAYPGLDYLKAKGFQTWASPWQSPFSFTRYAQARGVPVMGTLWTGPPGCWSSRAYGPVTALYAQAAWNPTAAPPEVTPEPAMAAAAQRATEAELWGRGTAGFPTSSALLLSPGAPGKPARLSWPRDAAKASEQHAGVPFSFAAPASRPALPGRSQPLQDAAGAAYVLLRGTEKLALDGANAPRGESQIVLFAAPRTDTGTNRYGVEVAVSDQGEVLRTDGNGPGSMAIPPGGFVLSAHEGRSAQKARRLLALVPGDRVGVFNSDGSWLGGYEPAGLKAELPGGESVAIQAASRARGDRETVLYLPGDGDGQTGTNVHGVEARIAGGKVLEVRRGEGNAAIPAGGFVLSAHNDAPAAAALGRLQPGDAVRLVIAKGGKERPLDEALAAARWSASVGAPCRTLYLAIAAESTAAAGTLLGQAALTYADGSREAMPVRCGHQALALSGHEPPQAMDAGTWVLHRAGEPSRALVCEWQNPKPGAVVSAVSFEPAPAALEVGYRVLAVTAALAAAR